MSRGAPFWRPWDGGTDPFGIREKKMGMADGEFKTSPFGVENTAEWQMNARFGCRSAPGG